MRHDIEAFGDFEVTTVVGDAPFFENGFLVRHLASGAAIAIDPGAPAERFIAEAARVGGRIGEVWLTHGHPDHISGVNGLMDGLRIPCRAHAEEKPVIDGAPRLASAMMQEGFRPVEGCSWFDGEPSLDLAGTKIAVLHMPGHTPGGVVFIFDGFAFTGDTLFNQGIGRTDLPGGSSDDLVASIDRLLDELPPATVLFSGHGPTWTAGEAKPWWGWLKSHYRL